MNHVNEFLIIMLAKGSSVMHIWIAGSFYLFFEINPAFSGKVRNE